MKKYFCLLLVLFCVLLAACNQNSESEKGFKDGVNCEDVMNAVIGVTEHLDAEKIYLKSSNNLDFNNFSLWVDGLYGECEEFNLLSDYAIFVSAGTTTYEVAVLKTDKIENIDKLKELLERRKETLSLGDKGMYDPNFETRINNSKVLTAGEFVILLITDDNDAALEAIEKLK